MKNSRYIVYAVIIALAVLFPFFAGAYPQHMAARILIYATLALSWDMVVRSGQLPLSIAGFFGLGGYAAVLSFLNWGIDPLLSMAFGGLMAFVMALVLGIAILRIKGLYFAIATLALSEIFRVVVTNWPDLTGGSQGKVLPSAIFGGDLANVYWLVLSIALITVVISEVLHRSRVHLALTSIRNNEVLARSSGIDVLKYLLFVFTVTAAIQGVVGGAYAHIYAFVSPTSAFNPNFILLPVTMAVVGGMGSTLGPMVGAIFLGLAGEYLKLQIPYGHLLVYGVIIVVVILFMPKGIVGTIRARLEER
jgi:branched-chain amino acid transport system permease protein